METQDGFIVGVHNYCDRWCERCPLTGRCRVFAYEQRLSLDTQADTSPGLVPVLRSLGAVAAALEEGDGEPRPGGDLQPPPPATSRVESPALPARDAALHARVSDIGRRLWGWIAPESRARNPFVQDAAAVLQHFAVFLGPKVFRALHGREVCAGDGLQSDALGSAKVALIACDRLADAWLCLAEHGAISVLEAAPVLTELQQIGAELERLFPRARDFVRPGFDEPAELAMLEWRERG